MEHSFRLGFKASNNESEYEALLVGLSVVSNLGAKEVEVYSDSRLVVNQVQGRFEAKDPRVMKYFTTGEANYGSVSERQIGSGGKGAELAC